MLLRLQLLTGDLATFENVEVVEKVARETAFYRCDATRQTLSDPPPLPPPPSSEAAHFETKLWLNILFRGGVAVGGQPPR
jgi:hypothetical protein